MSEIRRQGHEYVGVLTFDAEDLRNIAYALGLHDVGAQEMLRLADEVDAMNGVNPDADRRFACPRCQHAAPWTDGTVEALGDERDEFWCQRCGAETPLADCEEVAP